MHEGFTLIELLIVLLLISLICGLGLTISLGTHRQTIFENDVELIMNQLYLARTAAMLNKNGLPHGIKISDHNLTLFTGETYQVDNPDNQNFPISLSLLGLSNLEIIFQPLSGLVHNPLTFTLTNGFASTTITINQEGAILN